MDNLKIDSKRFLKGHSNFENLWTPKLSSMESKQNIYLAKITGTFLKILAFVNS